MKKTYPFFFVIVILGLLSACSSPSSTTSYKSYTPSPAPDFSEYKTFAYMDFTSKKTLSPKMLSGLLTVEAAITNQMQQKGFTLVNFQNNPDLLINLGTFLSQKTEFTETFVALYPDQNVYYCGATSYMSNHNPVSYQSNLEEMKYDEGNLLIDLIDAKTNKLVWHGSVSHIFKDEEKNVNLKTLEKEILNLFDKKFPEIEQKP